MLLLFIIKEKENMTCNKTSEIMTTGVEYSESSNLLVYTIPAESLNKLSAYNIIFSQDIPATTPIEASIVITNGTNNYNVLTRKGMALTAGDITTRDGIRTWFSGTSFVLRYFINI